MKQIFDFPKAKFYFCDCHEGAFLLMMIVTFNLFNNDEEIVDQKHAF